MLTNCQNPEEADNIMKIQRELDETKIVLHKTIESVLQRGEKIDDLVQKSDGLSSQSKMFYREFFRHVQCGGPVLTPTPPPEQAKKQNSCW